MLIITFFVLYCNPFSCIKYNFIAFYRFFFVQISHLGLLSYFICRHFLHKNAISFRWIVNKHMGHGTDQFSILQDRASGQSLHDSAGQLQQVLILHMKTDSLILSPGV